ncbi:hypothetical protein K3495_g9065 [Podosphaera aphanis]|nr:hypothetical protein K3495_g9065 [Podosphaera aphanis]
MAAIQLSFSLQTSAGVRSVQLLGSWDNYTGHLPLSKDRASSKPGQWRGTFRFQGSTLQPGQRYWYYYIIDRFHVSYDPSHISITEPTTRRVLNILDIPREKYSYNSASKSHSSKQILPDTGRRSKSVANEKATLASSRRAPGRESHNLTVEIPKGRPLSFSKIQSPKPITPYATKFILEADYGVLETEKMTSNFGSLAISNNHHSRNNSPSSSISSQSSGWSSSASPSSDSSLSDYSSSRSSSSKCGCERYGITRGGNRIKLDCGGSRCGYIDDSSSCCSSSEEDNSNIRPSRRNGMLLRRV